MKAIIVEDEVLVCELLAKLIQKEFGFKVVAQVCDGESALQAFTEVGADLVITDLLLPKLDGLELSRRLLKAKPDLHILAISSECDEYTVTNVCESGILGFLDKNDMSVNNLRDALSQVVLGRNFYSDRVQQVMRNLRTSPDAYCKILTDREVQVIRLIAEGKNHEAVGGLLGISALTVRRHKHNAMRKIDVHNEAELLRYAIEKGIVKSKGGLDWTGAGKG